MLSELGRKEGLIWATVHVVDGILKFFQPFPLGANSGLSVRHSRDSRSRLNLGASTIHVAESPQVSGSA